MPTSRMGDRDKRWGTRGRARHVGDERGGRKEDTEGEQKGGHGREADRGAYTPVCGKHAHFVHDCFVPL